MAFKTLQKQSLASQKKAPCKGSLQAGFLQMKKMKSRKSEK